METSNSREAHLAARRSAEEQQQARAAETLKDHKYTCLVKTADVEVWRCKGDGIFYAFDIMMTRFGIAIVGDIDNLTFSVGLGYGMPFLAGKDVTYYIHSKLSECHKKRVFSEDLFRAVLMTGICRELHSECSEELWDALPGWAQDSDQIKGSHWAEFRQIVLKNRRDLDNGDDRWMHWDDLLTEAEQIGFKEEAQVFMRDNQEALFLGPEWYESRIDEVCSGLIRELYLINHAAKAIIAQTATPEVAA